MNVPKANGRKNKFQIRGVFFSTTKRVINSPRSTTQSPRLHHKNTTPKRTLSRPPLKNAHKTASLRPTTTPNIFLKSN